MIREREKTFGRKYMVDLLDMRSGMSPTVGFETDRPCIQYVMMPYGEIGVKIVGSDPMDVVVRIDNKVRVQRKLEGKVVHTISRGDDGKPLFFLPEGVEPPEADTKPGSRPKRSSKSEAAREPKQLGLFPEAGPVQDDYESNGLVVVQVRFSHIKPDYAPMLPPDDFDNLIFQMNNGSAHFQAVSKHLPKMVAPEQPPYGMEGVMDEEGKWPNANSRPLPDRVCSVAFDRHCKCGHSH